MNYLIVIDMQNDFIDGTLGTPEATAIVDDVANKIRNFDGEVLYTRDVHPSEYSSTQEGRMLPVAHCIEGTNGYQICNAVKAVMAEDAVVFDKKSAFGSVELIHYLRERVTVDTCFELCGLCTDICVITNALMLKAAFPENPITLDSACCAGVTKKSHEAAIATMRMCQIIVS